MIFPSTGGVPSVEVQTGVIFEKREMYRSAFEYFLRTILRMCEFACNICLNLMYALSLSLLPLSLSLSVCLSVCLSLPEVFYLTDGTLKSKNSVLNNG